MTLYELNHQFEELMIQYDNGADSTVDEETGEILPIEDALSALAISREEKIDNTILYMKNLKYMEDALKAEADSLKKRRERVEKRRRSLEAYIAANMGDTRKRETPQYKLTIRQSVETIAPTRQEDIMRLPEDFRTAKWTPNKTAIKEALANGAVLPGCQLSHKKNLLY